MDEAASGRGGNFHDETIACFTAPIFDCNGIVGTALYLTMQTSTGGEGDGSGNFAEEQAKILLKSRAFLGFGEKVLRVAPLSSRMEKARHVNTIRWEAARHRRKFLCRIRMLNV